MIEYTYEEIKNERGEVIFLIRLANDKDLAEDKFKTLKECKIALGSLSYDKLYYSTQLIAKTFL